MARAFLSLAVACLLTTSTSSTTFAQNPREKIRMLEQWARVSDDPFTSVIGARELSDGRLLVCDQGEPGVYVVDASSGTRRLVTGRGDGPGEMRHVDRIFALRHDSSLVVDQSRRRWLILAGDRVVATIARSAPDVARLPFVEGIDATGSILDVRPFSFRRSKDVPLVRERTNAESLLVILRPTAVRGTRVDGRRLAQRADSLARIGGRASGQVLVRRSKPPPASLWLLENPLATEDQVLLFPDGWLAFALADPYRVDWRAPDGSYRRGRVLPFERVAVGEPMRRTLVRERWPLVEPPFQPGELPAWPKYLPAFDIGALVPMRDGRLAIRRTTDPMQKRVVYDVVGRTGQLELQLVLPPRTQLVAWGRAHVYAVSTGENLEQWVVRHPWKDGGVPRS
ncbi:MAG: hypothetical protein IT360_14425 [Gemmatimonadaceae bacterium]|nr:hypothetical protein [Gemmatimonadaceae bacterium]